MRQDEKEELRQRFQFRCGYCGVREFDVGAELTVDHFHPSSHGGSDEPNNWVYCCHACNEFKGEHWQPESARRILHPFRDPLAQHVLEGDDGALRALTETGTFHIERLHLNRPALVAHRRERRLLEAARHAQAKLLEELKGIDEQLRKLMTDLDEMQTGNG
ncbi:MAG: HNH endonuclease [Planctomycetes bacterium]|nr:HNH endonuclease [Planctomycetota bacterium]